MLEYLATVLGMHTADGFMSTADAAERKPKQEQVVVVPPPTCNFKEPQKIRECLDRKFKDDQDTHPEMWDPNWIKK